MKVVLNSQSEKLFTDFLKLSKQAKDSVEIIDARLEKSLFDNIIVGDVNAFIIENSTSYYQKAIDFIKKKHPYILVIVINSNKNDKHNNADIVLPYIEDISYLYYLVIRNISNYERNFNALKRLTTRLKDKIEFKNCIYDPNQRTLFYKEKEITKFSEKAGGILEILAANYGNLVKKELILEKVWFRSDWWAGRSMDVYVTNIRKIFREHNINMKIKNISKSGLILE